MIKISDSVYSVGVLNPNLRVFDIVMRTDFGTSYNSYLVCGEKKALIETCHDTFFEAYLENIREVCDPAEIDYIILNHTEPDHSGALYRLLELCPKAEIVCSQAASIYLKNITNAKDFQAKVVRDNDTLDLGGGRELRFINAPFLHWPDSMFTYLPDERVLFSCDFFGSHYCEPRMIDVHITYPAKYQVALKGYFDAIFGPFRPYVLKGIEKIKDLPIDYVCTSHGPVLTPGGLFPQVLAQYTEWAQPVKNDKPQIPIFYCSAYENTQRVAEKLREGVLAVLPEAEVPLYNIIDHDMGLLQEKLGCSDAFMVGSPTINRDAVPPIWELLSHVDAINNQKKPVLVFGSFGWSGEAVPAIISRLSLLKLAVFGEGFKVNFVPDEQDLEKAVTLGREFAESLKK